MSRIREVWKNKNKIEKMNRNRRKEEIASIKQDSAFKARLYGELRKIDVLLDSDEIRSVVIKIPDNFIAKFGAAIYSEDLAEYDIQQVEGTANKFCVRRKIIVF